MPHLQQAMGYNLEQQLRAPRRSLLGTKIPEWQTAKESKKARRFHYNDGSEAESAVATTIGLHSRSCISCPGKLCPLRSLTTRQVSLYLSSVCFSRLKTDRDADHLLIAEVPNSAGRLNESCLLVGACIIKIFTTLSTLVRNCCRCSGAIVNEFTSTSKHDKCDIVNVDSESLLPNLPARSRTASHYFQLHCIARHCVRGAVIKADDSLRRLTRLRLTGQLTFPHVLPR